MPSRTLLTSMTFLTVWEAIQLPAVARESVATMMPPWKRKARVVVPWASLMGQSGLERSSVAARSQDAGCADVSEAREYALEVRTDLGDWWHGEFHGEVVGRVHEVLAFILEGIRLLSDRAAVLAHEGIHLGGRLWSMLQGRWKESRR